MKELENKIRKALPNLQNIEVGQKFTSMYYGVITATKIIDWGKGVYSIYGFDEKDGLPRDCYYPKDLELLGHPIKLNDVLEYWKKRTNATSATAFKNELHKIVMNWDLSSVFLADQDDELKDFLNSL